VDPTSPNHPESKRKERRQHPRTKVAVEVDLQPERTATLLRVKSADLSLGGLYVEMMFTLEVGTKLKIVLWLNDVQVSTGGLVVTRDLQVGNGIKFIDLATEERLTLKRFLAVAGNPQSPESTNQTGPGQKRNLLESP
jgi:c-di-GMP-binding flagellar brake protein YcgR